MGEGGILEFKIDVVLYDARSGQPNCVLDTKYKTDARPSPGDVAQVVTYAQLKGCREAILVYPDPAHQVLDVTIGTARVRSLGFCIDGDLDLAGQAFLAAVLAKDPKKPRA
jgi:5-methylcytosine-specific restriction enzyme subunit McrC